ncbi:hypothetical protein GCM10020367_65060 [Streptomyces sannanensis]|uniref:Uncharacterized protein n=1 Tax=Streptomyces sannanensis TaxID=285536 RepID=A0ABP6SLX8_9ACTN
MTALRASRIRLGVDLPGGDSGEEDGVVRQYPVRVEHGEIGDGAGEDIGAARPWRIDTGSGSRVVAWRRCTSSGSGRSTAAIHWPCEERDSRLRTARQCRIRSAGPAIAWSLLFGSALFMSAREVIVFSLSGSTVRFEPPARAPLPPPFAEPFG